MNKIESVKIFIAEDHPVVTLGLLSIFDKAEGFEVVGIALSGQELREKLLQSHPQVLILDLKIPGSDFIESISWVKEHSPWIKIIAYSAYYSPDLLRTLSKNNVHGYVHKSSESEELMRAVYTVLKGEKYFSTQAQSLNGFHSSIDVLTADDSFHKRLQLSKREVEILVLICQGHSSTQIGKSLFISRHTVEAHRKNIFRKLDVNSSTELVKFAYQHGLV
jgi:DNA-binding NarL/FixJ family response regulator